MLYFCLIARREANDVMNTVREDSALPQKNNESIRKLLKHKLENRNQFLKGSTSMEKVFCFDFADYLIQSIKNNSKNIFALVGFEILNYLQWYLYLFIALLFLSFLGYCAAVSFVTFTQMVFLVFLGILATIFFIVFFLIMLFINYSPKKIKEDIKKTIESTFSAYTTDIIQKIDTRKASLYEEDVATEMLERFFVVNKECAKTMEFVICNTIPFVLFSIVLFFFKLQSNMSHYIHEASNLFRDIDSESTKTVPFLISQKESDMGIFSMITNILTDAAILNSLMSRISFLMSVFVYFRALTIAISSLSTFFVLSKAFWSRRKTEHNVKRSVVIIMNNLATLKDLNIGGPITTNLRKQSNSEFKEYIFSEFYYIVFLFLFCAICFYFSMNVLDGINQKLETNKSSDNDESYIQKRLKKKQKTALEGMFSIYSLFSYAYPNETNAKVVKNCNNLLEWKKQNTGELVIIVLYYLLDFVQIIIENIKIIFLLSGIVYCLFEVTNSSKLKTVVDHVMNIKAVDLVSGFVSVEDVQSFSFTNVSIGYDKNAAPILHNINLSIDLGMFILVEGSSGAGKSTFIKSTQNQTYFLEGIATIFDGSNNILLNNINPSDLKRNHIGVCQQNPIIPGNPTMSEFLSSNERPLTVDKMKKILSIVKMDSWFNRNNLETTYLGRNGSALSGGQKTRTCIAQILARDSKFIFLDESLDNLDNKTTEEILNTFMRLYTDIFQLSLKNQKSKEKKKEFLEELTGSKKTFLIISHKNLDLIKSIRNILKEYGFKNEKIEEILEDFFCVLVFEDGTIKQMSILDYEKKKISELISSMKYTPINQKKEEITFFDDDESEIETFYRLKNNLSEVVC